MGPPEVLGTLRQNSHRSGKPYWGNENVKILFDFRKKGELYIRTKQRGKRKC